jgi:hypothetical protein
MPAKSTTSQRYFLPYDRSFSKLHWPLQKLLRYALDGRKMTTSAIRIDPEIRWSGEAISMSAVILDLMQSPLLISGNSYQNKICQV